MSSAPSVQRRSARVILRAPDGAVLLIEFVVERAGAPFVFWATPGGEVESGESDRAAAERELREELGLALDLDGPVHVAASTFEHKGVLLTSTDVFFTARCARDAPRLDAPTEEERTAMRRLRWWTADELAAAREIVFPEDLAALLRGLR